MMSSQQATEGEPENLYVFQDFNNSLLYSLGMVLNISLPRMPIIWTIRVFIGFWWIYSILVAVSYKAAMTAILANPEPR